MNVATARVPPTLFGRYALYEPIASGGMGTVHIGRLLGPVGFARTVAIKRLHPHLARDPDFTAMFIDEARLAARIRHPNVVATLDVVSQDGEVLLVLDYVHGEPLSALLRTLRGRGSRVPPPIAASIMAGVLHGLHAAHEARDVTGQPLGLVHRDVSPQNVLVGGDGIPRVLDFGVAKAAGRLQTTRDGQIKGKVAYMAPEQLRGAGLDRRTDIFAAGVVLWEMLAGARLYADLDGAPLYGKVLEGRVPSPSSRSDDVDATLEAITMHAVSHEASARFATAREMAMALEQCPLAPASTVSSWVESLGGDSLRARADRISVVEGTPDPGAEAAIVTLSPSDAESGVSQTRRPAGKAEATIEVVPAIVASTAAKWRPGALVSTGAASLVLAVVAGFAMLHFTARDTPATPATPSARPEPLAAPVAPPKASELVPPETALPDTPIAPLTATPDLPPPAASATGIVRPRRPKVAATPAPPPSASADSCNPPYEFDSMGVKTYKPQCLRRGDPQPSPR